MTWFKLETRMGKDWRYIRGIESNGIRNAIAIIENFHQEEGLLLDGNDWRLVPSTKQGIDELEEIIRRQSEH